ncbi:MAG: glutathione S-transferase family protein [Gammaproteobacteria bacterium]
MAYELYWGAGSPNAWRALLALEFKGLSYDSKLLEFSKEQHKSPEMLAMNPRGQVPVLKDGDVALYESVAIMAYLDKQHADKPLFGNTAYETGKIWQRVFEFQNYVCESIAGIVRPVFQNAVSEKITTLNEAVIEVDTEFKILNTQLGESDYVAGESITAADIVLFPFVQALSRAMVLPEAESLNLNFKNMEKHYPNIVKWVARIELIPGYDKTYPPNWKS